MADAISLTQVTKTYDGGAVKALRGVDLNVRPGEIVLMMGPSGSGKTTLLSVMGCILRSTSGSVQIQGREITNLAENELPKIRLEHIGFIFQSFNLFPTLTAGENIELALDLKGIHGPSARRRVSEMMDQVGLLEKYRAYPADLSGGQKQRVAIARALVGGPSIVLADEPTASLDSSTGSSIMQLLRDHAHKRERAVVVVTHDSRILEFADRIVRIEDGRIADREEIHLLTAALA